MRWYGRLRRPNEIATVRRKGRAASFPALTAYALPERAPGSRVGVTVSKAVGGAVVRNLVRRRIRGALDGHGAAGRPLRLLFVAKPAAAALPYATLARDVAAALDRLAGSG